jgi:hypothetical protein
LKSWLIIIWVHDFIIILKCVTNVYILTLTYTQHVSRQLIRDWVEEQNCRPNEYLIPCVIHVNEQGRKGSVTAKWFSLTSFHDKFTFSRVWSTPFLWQLSLDKFTFSCKDTYLMLHLKIRNTALH